MLDRSPQATHYYSDDYPLCEALIYTPGQHGVLNNKGQTYSVEADDAEWRHYLARLARKSHCFSRCLRALRTTLKLFVFTRNRRQFYKRRFPAYAAHVPDFIYP